ncbi:hypothetical protein FOZ61_002277 [Perkinsus olseni]|uniref:Salivary lipocalin n=1 Tax=Perkinsus olseni TaxID=32597 RepID=A0A7J6KTI8_PEROL|nr:hypothetical protein FOZ61_002277 [Perkinsus olseni]KAF4649871.1 hypothetical protein FOL46_001383 [Perkinsus olseni]
MYLCLAGLFFIFAAAHCDSDAFLGATESSSGGLGFPVDKTYVLYDSPTKKAPIQSIRFTREQGGVVYITTRKGRLPRGEYVCGYYLSHKGGAPRYTLRLAKECDEIVKDSDGYYDEYFLTGCNIENDYQYLNTKMSAADEPFPLQARQGVSHQTFFPGL